MRRIRLIALDTGAIFAFGLAFACPSFAGTGAGIQSNPFICGCVSDSARYERLNPHFKTAFDFLRNTDLNALPDGKVEIDGENVFAYVSTVDQVPIDEEGDFEAHRQYIDIHVPLTKEETIGVHTLTEREIALPFNEKDDYVLYRAKGDSVTVKPGEFVVFFPPHGGHRPGCTSQKSPLKGHRKLCVKVKAGPILKDLGDVYENPIPNLRSRQAIFPNLCELPDGRLLCCFVLAEAFEAADMRSYLSESMDGGKTWSKPWRMFQEGPVPESETCKVTALGGNRMMALGYAAQRLERDGQLANAATGGLLPHRVFCAFSEDGGKTWTEKRTIPDAWNAHTEASAPAVRLRDGALAAPITGFPDWEGQMTSRRCGRMLLSRDEGRTWSDDTVCMAFDGDAVTCYEQRFCVLDSGTIVNIGWNEDVSGKRLPNHITYSADNGKTFSRPISTGVMGQAASVCALGGERFLAVVAQRRDTDEPGVYAYVCDFSERKWNVTRSGLLWSASKGPLKRDRNAAEVFAFLKFGQPSVTRLRDGRILLCFWYQKDGQYRVAVGDLK